MFENSSVRLRPLAIGALVALGTLCLAAGPALADTEKGHTGKVGDHYLNDASGSEGTICHYNPDTNLLQTFEVKQPNIWARNRTSHRDSQKVGWRVIIKGRREGTTHWSTVLTSSIKKATAYDNASAILAPRTFNAPTLPAHASATYLVFIKMIWYQADGTVAGTALHRVDYYLEENGTSTTEYTSCPSQAVV